jgi:hypothetical protein
VGGCGLDSCGSGYGAVLVSCEHDNEFLGFIKGGKFLDYLFKKDSVPWSWLVTTFSLPLEKVCLVLFVTL